jgi:hypothetical protein
MLPKRLLIWFLETSLEAVLLAVTLLCLFGHDRNAYFKDLAINFVWIGTMFFSTGYLLSTLVARAIWQGRSLWIYSVIAAVLFSIHFEILNYAAGGAFNVTPRWVVRIAGACIAFPCTLAGTSLLRRWGDARDSRCHRSVRSMRVS